jgi:hypothetical protein
MIFQAITAFCLATLVLGTPVQTGPAQYPGFIVLEKNEVAGGGSLTWYGLDPSTNSTAPPQVLQRTAAGDCGSNAPVICSSNYQTNKIVCDSLIDQLRDQPNKGMDASPRSVCYTPSVDGDTGALSCCASWANPALGTVWGDLENGLIDAMNACTDSEGRLSAKTLNVNLDNVCTTQCTSNRPTGCS